MGRPTIKAKTYVYHHREYIGEGDSYKTAAAMANTSVTTVRNILNGKAKCTVDGWTFTNKLLSNEEIEQLADSNKEKPKLTRVNGKSCRKEIENQLYEVECRNGHVGYIPRSIEQRKALLRKILANALKERWLILPKYAKTLEKTLISELIDSI